MNIRSAIEHYFNEAASDRLAAAIGLEAGLVRKALSVGLPMQLDQLSQHADNPAGQTHIIEAISNLPQFASVAEALSSHNGTANLQQAGELLAPVLLAKKDEELAQRITQHVGGSLSGIQKLVHMTLPLLLSLLGQLGVNANNIGQVLAGLRGQLDGFSIGGVSVPSVTPSASSAAVPAAAVAGAGAAAVAADAALTGKRVLPALTPSALLDLLKAQFGGEHANKLGAYAGFEGNKRAEAVQAALPMALMGLVNKGKTAAGADALLGQSLDVKDLTDDAGNLTQLDNAALLSKAEAKGQGLLASLHGDASGLSNKLGAALGGNNAGAGKLMAVMSALLLSLLGNRARAANMDGAALSGVLSSLSGKLPALLPAGLSGLGALLGGTAVAGAAATGALAAGAATPTPAAPVATTVVSAVPEVSKEPVAPLHVPPAATPAPVTPVVTEEHKRSGFPWWLALLLIPLIILGGCLMRPPAPAKTEAAYGATMPAEFIINTPEEGSEVPASGFPIAGKGAPNATYSILRDGLEVANINADAEGNWNADVVDEAAPEGERLYTFTDSNNKEVGKLNVMIAPKGEAAGTAATDSDAQAAQVGGLTVESPAEGATVPAEGFDVTGTGKAGDQYELFENGVSVGTFTVAEDGKWTIDVPGTDAGEKSYVIKGIDGNEVASFPLTVQAAVAVGTCDKDLTISLSSDETVSAPYRFGGVGSAKSYDITVKRGERVVGRKKVILGANCIWGYQSDPGGREGEPSEITYEVRPEGTADTEPAMQSITLTVKGSGTNR